MGRAELLLTLLASREKKCDKFRGILALAAHAAECTEFCCCKSRDAPQVFKQAKVKAGKAVSVSSKASASGA